MHTLWLFFSWPQGGAWSNVAAMPLCGALAALAAFLVRDRLGRALSGFWHRHFGHRGELDALNARLDAHADLLDPSTPGGLAAVIAAVDGLQDTVAGLAEVVRQVMAQRAEHDAAVAADAHRAATAAESAFVATQVLAAHATGPQPALPDPEPAPVPPVAGKKAPASGMGSRAPKGGGKA